jgi:pyrimidine operon attenuation protein/uracil phosphoribosyltransferase
MNDTSDKTLILNSAQVDQKIRRIAFEIFENNFKEKSLVLAGIDGQGYAFAKLLANELATISTIEISVTKVTLDKLAPRQSEVVLDIDPKDLKKKCIVLVDDVLNSGRTLAYGMKALFNGRSKKN